VIPSAIPIRWLFSLSPVTCPLLFKRRSPRGAWLLAAIRIVRRPVVQATAAASSAGAITPRTRSIAIVWLQVWWLRK